MKLLVCRKRKKNILTFEYSKMVKKQKGNKISLEKFKIKNKVVNLNDYFPVLVVDNLKNREL
mgnify:CR=1 FL=1